MYIELSLVTFVDTLTIISSCIYKQRKSSSVFKKALLLKVIARSKEISIYKNYSLRFYTVFPLDSTQCIKYIRSNCSGYNILSPIVIQLKVLSSTYICLEIELEDAFERQI